ncbi:YndJ family protein [Halobacillus salinarum]|uniref:YndJ family protein n=1 Tax=Halobacillus salinarum TaxID=2932257 RepID=A0ABY4ELH8_9BACI|nr:YndJ family protein [Halobacillus salinarum]UOQ44432.1 YndJ family protein [Halobacillus salinarum]
MAVLYNPACFWGIMRLLGRGFSPIEETTIDIGFIYIAVGGGWLVLSSGGFADFLPYQEPIIQLTAIHFHYAAFVLPLVTGFFGRYLYASRKSLGRAYTVLACGIMAGPFLVAIGLDQGPPLEVVTVGVYVILLAWLCSWWLIIARDLTQWSKVGLRLASVLLLMTMGFSFAYSLGLLMETYWLGIGGMLKWHGAVNSFCFSLLAVLAWRGVHPGKRYDYGDFPVSRIRGKGYVGDKAVYEYDWVNNFENVDGLISNWEDYNSHAFSSSKVSESVKHFYLSPENFQMKADIQWEKGFGSLSHLIYRITKRLGQINLPPNKVIDMEGEIVAIKDDEDGRKHVRAWIRRNAQTKEPIFTALYSSHEKDGERYMNIGLPFPRGTMTGVLRFLNQDNGGLILTSIRRKDAKGDEGVYFSLGDWTIRTPLREYFYVYENEKGLLSAYHYMSIGKLPLLKISYQLKSMEKL